MFFAPVALAVPAADGLYATFQTNHGEFVARLEFQKAPVTVANFVSLAEGSRLWLDAPSGGLKGQPFYDGLTFHRVISGFMIQGGSRNGLGSDRPGYRFGDEFHRDLTHNAPGVLSMANSGPSSNGSQFFITLAPTSWLNLQHSVFGSIVEGMEVVQAIGGVPTGVNAKPVEPVVMQSVTITRKGAAAQAFNPHAYGLPALTDARPVFTRETWGDAITLGQGTPFSEYFFSGSENLTNWNFLGSIANKANLLGGAIDVTDFTEGKPKYFFQVPYAKYQNQPVSWIGRTLSLNITSGATPQSLVYQFFSGPRDAVSFLVPLGNSTLDGTPGLIGAYLMGHNLESHSLVVISNNVGIAMSYNLYFHTPTSGHFTCQDFATEEPAYWPIFGTFTVGTW